VKYQPQKESLMETNKPGADGDHVTFCRICEACCGVIATVENGKVVRIVPDRDNRHSQGHVCVKGTTFHNVTHDEDRVVRPLKRIGGPGDFEQVSWAEALEDIAGRLGTIIDRYGPEAVASYKGNPIA
jgi:anaerobic selenocysteine-containing dehydrogenase